MKKSLIALVAALATLMALAIPANAQDSEARIHLIHGIPGVDVDVLVDGSAVIEGFSFEDTQDLSSFAGQTLAGVQVNAAGTDDTLIDVGDLALPAEGNVTAIAYLDADGNPTVKVFENNTDTVAAGNGRLVVRHTAAAPGVDVKANGEVAFTNIENGGEDSADLPAGTISAEVVPTGEDEPVVIGPADLPVTDGEALIVYAVGNLDDGLSVITETIDGLGEVPDEVPTGDSPISNNNSLVATLLVAAAAMAAAGLFATGRLSLGTASTKRG